MATAAELLAKVDTAIEAILDGGAVQSYSIGSRNLSRMSIKDLRDLRTELKREVSAATIASGDYRPFKQIGVRFRRPS